MLWFSRKQQKSDIRDTVNQATDIQESAKIKVRIASAETDKLQRLIRRAQKNKDVTLTIMLATNGDRRVK